MEEAERSDGHRSKAVGSAFGLDIHRPGCGRIGCCAQPGHEIRLQPIPDGRLDGAEQRRAGRIRIQEQAAGADAQNRVGVGFWKRLDRLDRGTGQDAGSRLRARPPEDGNAGGRGNDEGHDEGERDRPDMVRPQAPA
jgi:hypothetical protein